MHTYDAIDVGLDVKMDKCEGCTCQSFEIWFKLLHVIQLSRLEDRMGKVGADTSTSHHESTPSH